MKCHYHPNREAVQYCQKKERGLCKECLRCLAPDSYCPYRKNCMIYFQWKQTEEYREWKAAKKKKSKEKAI